MVPGIHTTLEGAPGRCAGVLRSGYRGTRRFRGVLVALLALIAFLAATESAFLTEVNISNVLRGRRCSTWSPWATPSSS